MIFGIIWAAAAVIAWTVLLIADRRKKPAEKDVVYLPGSLFAVGTLLLAGGSAAAVYGAVSGKWLILPFGAVICLLGVAAMLCRINQRITAASDNEFVYTSFLGRKRRYTFDDVVDVRVNPDSYTVFMKKGKMHVETLAHKNGKFMEKLLSLPGDEIK